MYTIKIEQFKSVYQKGKTQATGVFGGNSVTFFFGTIKTGFGFRHYFICPICGQYRTILTFNGKNCICFRCAGVNPYSGIQTTTRGGDKFIMYKMERYAQKHGIAGLHYPFDYHDYERPKHHKRERWNTTMKVLQALESMRNQAIFFEKVWSVKTIKSIENGTNDYLQLPASLHLTYFYPYDGKPQVNPFQSQKREICTE